MPSPRSSTNTAIEYTILPERHHHRHRRHQHRHLTATEYTLTPNPPHTIPVPPRPTHSPTRPHPHPRSPPPHQTQPVLPHRPTPNGTIHSLAQSPRPIPIPPHPTLTISHDRHRNPACPIHPSLRPGTINPYSPTRLGPAPPVSPPPTALLLHLHLSPATHPNLPNPFLPPIHRPTTPDLSPQPPPSTATNDQGLISHQV